MHWSQGKDGDTSSGGRKHDSNRASNGCIGDTSFTLHCQQTRFRQGQKFRQKPAQLAQTWLEIQDVWSLLGVSIRPDSRPLNKRENFLWPWLGLSRGKMPGEPAPLLLSSCESLCCWKHEHYLFGCLCGRWASWVKSHPDRRCHALENVAPRCCLSKSPAMCLNQMQSMQSPFLIKAGFPLSLFLKSAVMSLLQPPMHSAMVSKMCSDLMSTALGVTLLWSKAEQWEEEAKSAQSWWLVSCPYAVQQSTKYPSLQWGKGIMKQLQERETKLEWGLQIRCKCTLQINQCTSKSFSPSHSPLQISLDLKLEDTPLPSKTSALLPGQGFSSWFHNMLSYFKFVFLGCTSPNSWVAIAAATLIKCSSIHRKILCFGG